MKVVVLHTCPCFVVYRSGIGPIQLSQFATAPGGYGMAKCHRRQEETYCEQACDTLDPAYQLATLSIHHIVLAIAQHIAVTIVLTGIRLEFAYRTTFLIRIKPVDAISMLLLRLEQQYPRSLTATFCGVDESGQQLDVHGHDCTLMYIHGVWLCLSLSFPFSLFLSPNID